MSDSHRFLSPPVTSELAELVTRFASKMSETNDVEWGLPRSIDNAISMIRFGLSRLEVSGIGWARDGLVVGLVELDDDMQTQYESLFTVAYFCVMTAVMNEPDDKQLSMFSGFLSGEMASTSVEQNTSMSRRNHIYTQTRADLDTIESCGGKQDVIAQYLAQIVLRLHRMHNAKKMFEPETFSRYLSQWIIRHCTINNSVLRDDNLYALWDETETREGNWLTNQLQDEDSSVTHFVGMWDETLAGDGKRFSRAIKWVYGVDVPSVD